MTTIIPDILAHEIENLVADLRKVKAMIDILGQPAIDKAKEVEDKIATLREQLSTALANKAMEDRAKRLSGFSNMRVEVKAGDNLMSTGFVIRYEKPAWDMDLKESVPKMHECNGFALLSDDAYDYLVNEKSGVIPAVIMNLAPGKPQEAMSIYLQGKARGYFKGQPSA